METEFNLSAMILYEDDDIVVLNKPAGLVVNRAESVRVPCVQDLIAERYAQDPVWQAAVREDEEFALRSGMVHRIDKDTSGTLIFAKTVQAMRELMRQFHDREVKKTYLALVHGKFTEKVGVVQASIERHHVRRDRFAVAQDGRPSETAFRVTQEFSGVNRDKLLSLWRGDEKVLDRFLSLYKGFSLMELYPKTGRTHQIRVHMQYLQHPLVGDGRYTGRKRERIDSAWCPRQFLHAFTIEFAHPRTGENVKFEAPLAEDLKEVLTYVE